MSGAGTIRDARPADFPAIVRLNLESEHFMSRMGAGRLEELASQCVYLRVAEEGGEVAAFLIAFAPDSAYDSENFGWFRERYPSFLYIDRIAVDSRFRGRGLGVRMYEDVFAFARENGFDRVVAEFDVEPPNPVSAKLHERFGFREVGSRSVSYAAKRVAMQEAPLSKRAQSRAMETPSSDKPALPDRLSVDPRSPHHVAAIFEHDVGIRFNGKERHDVEEYCVSEGWVRVPAGKTLDRHGRPLLIKIKGVVEAFYK